MTDAFVLSGGASLGAMQVGMARALLEHDIHPHLLVGASVGAMNAAWMAGHGEDPTLDLNGLEQLWKGLSRADIFPLEFLGGLLGFVGKRRSLLSDHGLRRLLDHALTFAKIEEAALPLAVIATDVLTGELVVLDGGPAEPAIRASASIPAVFPPVRHRGRWLMDGGVASNTPLQTAVAMGATRIFVLPAQTVGVHAIPTNAIGMAVHAVSLLIDARVEAEQKELAPDVEIVMLEADATGEVSPIDFSKTGVLIEAGYSGASRVLSNYFESDPTSPQ